MVGFSDLDALRANREITNIQIIVSTAKELTAQEKNRLKGQIRSIIQKGNFLSAKFLDEVRSFMG